MAFTIASIVEGHGEVAALPLLIRRLLAEAEVPKPIRVSRDQLIKPNNPALARSLELAAARIIPGSGAVLILIDSEGDCPKEAAPGLLARARKLRSDLSIHVILAHPMFEAWFLASASSLSGRRSLPEGLADHPSPEEVQNPKAWLNNLLPRTRAYSEIIDQPALSEALDLQRARSSPSFDKFCRELEAIRHIAALR